MEAYETSTGGRVLALAHYGNVLNGLMLPVENNPATGESLSGGYAERRAKRKPMFKITQTKGYGEAHPFLSPKDKLRITQPETRPTSVRPQKKIGCCSINIRARRSRTI